MLSELQCKRLLKQVEEVQDKNNALDMSGDEGPMYFDAKVNEGWVQALRLVLEVNGLSEIRNTPLGEDNGS